MPVRQNNMRRGVWIRVKLTTYPGMNLSHQIYSAPYSPVQTFYISFDLLTLMVSLKISSSISNAILKPLIFARERGGEGGSSFPVWWLSDIFHWPVTQWAAIASRTHRASRGSPSVGCRAPLTGCCIPASSLTQEPAMTKYSTRIRGWDLDPLVSCICIVCVFVLNAFMCICAFILLASTPCILWCLNPGLKWFGFSKSIIHTIKWFFLQKMPSLSTQTVIKTHKRL